MGNDVEHRNVPGGGVGRNENGKDDFPDEGKDPRDGFKKISGALHLLDSMNEYAAEKVVTSTGQECFACEGEMMERRGIGLVDNHFEYLYGNSRHLVGCWRLRERGFP